MDGSNYLQARWDADLSMKEVLNGSTPRLPRDASGIVRMEGYYLPSLIVIKSGLLVAPVFDPLLPTLFADSQAFVELPGLPIDITLH
jgi:hypothetical protein